MRRERSPVILRPMRKPLPLLLVVLASTLVAQTTPPFGIRTKTPQFKALINARIIVSPSKTIEKGTLVIKDGRILDVGESVAVPPGAVTIDLKGKCVYPGFIDPYAEFGLPAPEKPQRSPNQTPKYEGTRSGANDWNDAIHAQDNWVDKYCPDDKQVSAFLSQGITAVQSGRIDGIFRGSSFVTLVGSGLTNDLVLKSHAYQWASFNKGNSVQEYPSSLMGSIALIRQTLLDVDWYRKAHEAFTLNPNQKMPELNLAIEALASVYRDTLVFETDDELSLVRAWRLSREFSIPMIQVGSGHEYERLAEIAACRQPVIVPVNFPTPPEINSTDDDLDVRLADLRHWERAPYNPAVLDSEKVPFAFTTYRMKDNSLFLKNVRKAVKCGLNKQTALAALTTMPAQLCGVSSEVGTIEKGKLADLLVTNTDIFTDSVKIYSVWVKGEVRELVPLDQVDFRGQYSLQLAGKSLTLDLKGEPEKPNGKLALESKQAKLEDATASRDEISFAAKLDSLGIPGVARFSAHRYGDTLKGMVVTPELTRQPWSALLKAPYSPEKDTGRSDLTKPDTLISAFTFPNMAFGYKSVPAPENVLVKNATIWTCEKDGVLEGSDLLVLDGKFAKVGKNLAAPAGVRVIDGSGLQITPGIIDEHSHLGGSGDINEGTFAVTSEVRIGDIINPDDIDIYRALAGGVTTIQVLHGSANPIGGQAQVIKPRWGGSSEDLKFAGATPGIKFALGENVKQSGWEGNYTIRYPQTRLGVETIIRDALQAAREYEQKWDGYRKLGAGEKARTIAPRRDLGLEALVEVLHSRMIVHCHAYAESEVLMLLRVAEDFGFRIKSIEHSTEGYKLADELVAHGCMASSVPDWWAYKFEVYDAIPQNPGLMNQRGVVVGIGSDSPEMGRRLNQEAAKSILYTDMSQEDALRMVTLNPARQLNIDGEVGSIKVGKDADFAVWNANPLSIYARVQQTWIDGRRYFDIETDRAMRESLRKEKSALIQKVLAAQKKVDFRKGDDSGYKPPQPEASTDAVRDLEGGVR